MQQELRKQHCLLLARLTELERQIWKERDEYISKVTEEVTWLGVQVKELEEKCQQPASELLQVRDIPRLSGIGEGFHRKGTLCCGQKILERSRKGRLFLMGGSDGYQVLLSQRGYRDADPKRLDDLPMHCGHVKGFGVRQSWV